MFFSLLADRSVTISSVYKLYLAFPSRGPRVTFNAATCFLNGPLHCLGGCLDASCGKISCLSATRRSVPGSFDQVSSYSTRSSTLLPTSLDSLARWVSSLHTWPHEQPHHLVHHRACRPPSAQILRSADTSGTCRATVTCEPG